ncbi:MAG: autotransporter domain-containing protein, partial [Chthoniobacteraceae bacterium]
TLLAGSGLGSGSGGFNHAFSSNSNVTVKGTGILDLGGFSNEIGSLSDGGVNTGIVQNSGTSAAMLGIGATNASGTFSGLVQDGGAPLELVKLGTGAQTLSGSNTYSGGTALETGTLFVDNNNALGSGTLTITGGTFSTHLQSGSLILNNNMLVQGDFSIAPPALGDGIQLDGAMDLGGAVRTITDTVSEGVIEFGGVISDGGITLSSTGSPAYISFNGISANTYTGLTTVNNNITLLLQANGNIPGNLMINQGGVVWDTTGNLLSATSSVMVNSSGTTTVFGTLGGLDIGGNNETIGTLFGTGKVQLNDGSIDGTGATKGGVLTVSSGSFSGVISDGSFGGQLVKTGTGILSLTGTSTYTGKTTVNAGLLQVNGSIASGTTIVNAGGTLGGVGTIGGNVFNGGLVAPGDAPGTLTIAGNYSQITAGTLVIQVGGLGAGQHDLLAVGGSAALSGTLQLVRLNNFQPKSGTSLTILTAAGGVTGQFSSVDTDTIMYVKVVYQPDDVVLDFGQKSFAGLPGLTPNQFVVARNLDFAANDPRNIALNTFLTGELLGNLPHDFDLISPEQLTSIFNISFSFADVQAGNIENRLAEIRAENTPSTNVGVSVRSDETTAGYSKDDDKKTVSTPSPETPRWNLFMEGNGEFVHVNGDTNAAGYNFTTGGVTVGGDYRVCDHFTLGIMGGYADTGATLTQGGAVDVNSGRVGIYSTTYGGGFYLNTLAAGGYNSYDTHRLGLGGIAQGNTDGEEFDGLISTGYDLHSGNFTVGPIASAQYTYVGINSFNENGSLAPLNIPSQNQESFRTKVGFKTSSVWHVNGIAVTPMVSAAWQHEYLDSTYALDSSFASGAGNVFTVTGPALGRDSVVVNAGVNVQWTSRFSTYLYYDGELGRKNYELNSVSGGVQFKY